MNIRPLEALSREELIELIRHERMQVEAIGAGGVSVQPINSALLAERDALKDDIAEYVRISSEQGAEIIALTEERDRLRAALQEATDALAGGLWDFGPGQDEHEKCNEVVERCRAALAQEQGGSDAHD